MHVRKNLDASGADPMRVVANVRSEMKSMKAKTNESDKRAQHVHRGARVVHIRRSTCFDGEA